MGLLFHFQCFTFPLFFFHPSVSATFNSCLSFSQSVAHSTTCAVCVWPHQIDCLAMPSVTFASRQKFNQHVERNPILNALIHATFFSDILCWEQGRRCQKKHPQKCDQVETGPLSTIRSVFGTVQLNSLLTLWALELCRVETLSAVAGHLLPSRNICAGMTEAPSSAPIHVPTWGSRSVQGRPGRRVHREFPRFLRLERA